MALTNHSFVDFYFSANRWASSVISFSIYLYFVLVKFMKRYLLALIIFLLTFLIVDFSLGRAYKVPWVLGYISHPEVDTYLRPGSSGWFTREGKSYVKVNNIGSNDSKNRYIKKQNVFRIAVIGDSYVEAVQVPSTKSFWYLLEVELNSTCKIPNKIYEVIPLGVSGHGPVQYYKTLISRSKKLSPDLNIVLFTTGNDVRNSSQFLEQKLSRKSLLGNRSFISVDKDGSIEIQKTNISEDLSIVSKILLNNINIVERSNLLKIAIEVYSRIQNRESAEENKGNENFQEWNDNNVYLPDSRLSKPWREAKLFTVKAVELIGEFNKISPVLAVIGTNESQVLPDLVDQQKILQDLRITDFKEPNRFFANSLKVNGIDYVDILDSLGSSGLGIHGTYPKWSGHWNTKGHKLVSKVIADKVCSRIKN